MSATTVMSEDLASRPVAGRAAKYVLPAIARPAGLYDPAAGKSSCGIGFVVNLHKEKSHKIIDDGLQILRTLEHRGAVGADKLMGDGAGIMVATPHRFFAREAERFGIALPEPGHYAVSSLSLPRDETTRAAMEKIVEEAIATEGQQLLGWRDVPVENKCLSKAPEIVASEPRHRQVIIGRGKGIADEDAFERKLYIVRKVISARIYAAFGGLKNDFYVVSMSCRTLIYKGMFLSFQLGAYYRDLHDPLFESPFALVHQRF